MKFINFFGVTSGILVGFAVALLNTPDVQGVASARNGALY
jgi:hypothetical protein